MCFIYFFAGGSCCYSPDLFFRGSTVLAHSLMCLLSSVQIVSRDCHPDHCSWRMNPIITMTAAHSASPSLNADTNPLHQSSVQIMMAKLASLSSSTTLPDSSKSDEAEAVVKVSVLKTSPAVSVVGDLNTTSVAISQWRADFLQRITEPLQLAFK